MKNFEQCILDVIDRIGDEALEDFLYENNLFDTDDAVDAWRRVIALRSDSRYDILRVISVLGSCLRTPPPQLVENKDLAILFPAMGALVCDIRHAYTGHVADPWMCSAVFSVTLMRVKSELEPWKSAVDLAAAAETQPGGMTLAKYVLGLPHTKTQLLALRELAPNMGMQSTLHKTWPVQDEKIVGMWDWIAIFADKY